MQSYAHLYASTIHRLIYRTKRSGDGNPAFGLAPNTRENTVFIVDEASMIGEGRARSDGGGMQYRSLLDDLMEFVFSGEGVGSYWSATTRSCRRWVNPKAPL